MSTRCQIQFIEGTDRTQVYKHSDGYTDNIFPLLRNLKRELDKTNMYRGVDYLASQFIFFDKLRHYKDDIETGYNNGGYYFLGHGVENPTGKIHGDEDFLYKVYITDNGKRWIVKVSETFTSFNKATWRKKREWKTRETRKMK